MSIFFGIDWAAEDRDPSAGEMEAAIPRLASILVDYHAAGRLKDARRWWVDRARALDARRKAKAMMVMNMAMNRMAASVMP